MTRHRILATFAIPILLMSAMGIGAQPALAAGHITFTAPQSAYVSAARNPSGIAKTSAIKIIDWAHPVHFPLASSLRSANIHPLLSAPPSSCYQAYAVSYGGTDTWQDTHIPGVTAYVTYWWCSTSPTDTVGLNYSVGYVCVASGYNYYIKYGSIWSYEWDGASDHSTTGLYEQDWEGLNWPPPNGTPVTWHLNPGCSNPDYSSAGPGDLQWSAQFWAQIDSGSNGAYVGTVSAISPTF